MEEAEYSDIRFEFWAKKPVDRNGQHVEDFGLPLNLMLAVPVRIVFGGLPEALLALAGQDFGPK